MQKDSKEVFETIRVLYDFKNLTELSIYFEKNGNWAAKMAKKGSVPFPQCVQTSIEKKVSMDYLLFGGEANRSVEGKISKLRNSVTDGVFRAIQTGLITPNEDVSISFITEVIMQDLNYIYEYNTDAAELMSEKLMENLNKTKQ